MAPPGPGTLHPLLAELSGLRDPEGARALSLRLGADLEATRRLVAAGVPLILVALVRRAATSPGDVLPALLDRAGPAASPEEDARQAEALLRHLFGSRRAGLHGQLQRLSGLDAASVRRFLAAVALRLLASPSRLREDPPRDARTLGHELGAALARAEDAAPGCIGAFEELLDTAAPVEEDLVRLGRELLESLEDPPGT